MSVKHTPAPWYMKLWSNSRCKDGFETVITDSCGHAIVTFNQKGRSEKVLANAKLIAFAPRMKKSIEDFLSIIHRLPAACSDPECSVCKENHRIVREAQLILAELEV